MKPSFEILRNTRMFDLLCAKKNMEKHRAQRPFSSICIFAAFVWVQKPFSLHFVCFLERRQAGRLHLISVWLLKRRNLKILPSPHLVDMKIRLILDSEVQVLTSTNPGSPIGKASHLLEPFSGMEKAWNSQHQLASLTRVQATMKGLSHTF